MLELRDRASAHTAEFHPEIGERREQKTQVMIARVSDIA